MTPPGFIDISRPVSPNTPVYEGDPHVKLTRTSTLLPGAPDSWNASQLTVGTHTATHVDPPAHFCPDGLTADRLDLGTLCGPALLIDLRGHRVITRDLLDVTNLDGVHRLLIRTDGSDEWELGFRRDYPHLSLDAARWLRERTMVKLVGIDTWSIEGWDSEGFPVHKCLLCESPLILIAEGLDLRAAPPGHCELLLLPLLVTGADGGLARAVLAPQTRSR